MRGHRRGSRGALWVAACTACVSADHLDRYVDSIEQMVLQAESAGAMGCAPRQLAVARSHLEFAQIEREQGFPSKALRHLEIADEHARAAVLLSPAAHCAARAVHPD